MTNGIILLCIALGGVLVVFGLSQVLLPIRLQPKHPMFGPLFSRQYRMDSGGIFSVLIAGVFLWTATFTLPTAILGIISVLCTVLLCLRGKFLWAYAVQLPVMALAVIVLATER